MVSSYSARVVPGRSAVHLAASANASSTLHEALMMTPDHEPAFVFPVWPARAKPARLKVDAARRTANAPAHELLFIGESSPKHRLIPDFKRPSAGLGLRIRSDCRSQQARLAISRYNGEICFR